jgi:hypothetical protein
LVCGELPPVLFDRQLSAGRGEVEKVERIIVLVLLGVVIALGLGLATRTVSAHDGDATLIHACVNQNSGELKIVSANATCKKNETPLVWQGVSAASKGSIMVHWFGDRLIGQPGPSSSCVGGVPLLGGLLGEGCGFRSPRDGTITNMRVLIFRNTYDGPVKITLTLNGNPTAISTTIAAGSTADINALGSASILDGDRVSVQADESAATTGDLGLNVSYTIE